eukprot:6442435-Prymnesium_polylepis.1
MQLGEVTRHVATGMMSVDGRYRSRGAGDARRGASPLGGKGAKIALAELLPQRRRLGVRLALEGGAVR